MPNSIIKSIKAREILDSRGNPTVEVGLITGLGAFRASVPSGVSRGKHEAVEIKASKAVKNVNQIIAPKLIGKDSTKQKEIDEIMINLDGTENKSKLGANAILAVSIAVLRAGAKAKNLPLYKYISYLTFTNTNNTFSTIVENAFQMPKLCFNIVNGGMHAKNNLDIQEFMIVPQFKSAKKSFQVAKIIYRKLKEIIKKELKLKSIKIGDEGGFSPPLKRTEDALNLILKAIKLTNYSKNVKLALDCAASHFLKNKKYKFEEKLFSPAKLLNFYHDLLKKYQILFLEDPFSEENWQGWQKLKSKIKYQKSKILIIGDDLTVTNPTRIKLAKEKKACNGIIIKPNQIGTISEAIEAAKLVKSLGWKIVVSHRSGETCDDFISDFAVGVGADFIKAGGPTKKERVVKYNRLLKIEEELRSAGLFRKLAVG